MTSFTVTDRYGIEDDETAPVLEVFEDIEDAECFIESLPDHRSGRYVIVGSEWDEAFDPEDATFCFECGEPMFMDDMDITHHGAPGEIDYDLDADHVAFVLEGFIP